MVTRQPSKRPVLDSVASGGEGDIVKPFDVQSGMGTLTSVIDERALEDARE
jgi:hypothetical protein